MLLSGIVCVVLKSLHLEKQILSGKECRRVGEAKDWWHDELALTVAVKPSAVVSHTLEVLKIYKGQWWYSRAASNIKGLHNYIRTY